MASQDWFDKDFYQVLGVSKDVSDADLKKTYRKLARTVSPGLQPGRRRRRGEVQGDQRGVLGALRRGAAQGVRPDPRDGLGRALHRGRPGRGRLRGRLLMFGQGRGGTRQSAEDFEDIFPMFNQQQGGRFGSGRFGQPTGGLPRVRRSDARRRRHGPHDRSTSSPRPRARRSPCRARTASRSR